MISKEIDSYSLFLSEAYRAKCDTIPEVKKEISRAEVSLMVAENQILYNEVVIKKISITEDELYNVYLTLSPKQESFEIEKPLIKKILEDQQRIRNMTDYENSIFAEAKVEFVNKTIEEFYEIHLNGSEWSFVIDDSLFNNIGHEIIAQYYLNEIKKEITISEFIDFYNHHSPRKGLNTLGNCFFYLGEMIFENCAYRDAIRRGLQNDPQYKLQLSIAIKSIMLKAFDTYILIPQLKISEQEIRNFYEENRDQFNDGEYAVISFKVFNSEIEAYEYEHQVMFDVDKFFSTASDSSVIFNHEIRYDSKEFPSQFINIIFNLKNGSFSSELKINGKYYVFYKNSESGSRVKTLDEVNDSITRQIRNAKLKELKNQILLKHVGKKQ